MPPKETLWKRDEHTEAKHRILRKYLERWLPIMAKWNPKLVVIDGFAGPGEYKDGEDGSPVIELKAFIEHARKDLIEKRQLVFVFIEERADRAAHLTKKIDSMRPLPSNVDARTIHGNYTAVISGLLSKTTNLAPTFAFIDPFGYKDTELALTSKILGFKKTEVLIYLPTPYLARFVDHDDTGDAFTTLYGDNAWEQAVPLVGAARRQMLHDLFVAAVERQTKWVRSFEIITAENMGYHLIFGTGNPLGLEKMKEVMWAVDRAEGARYRDTTSRGMAVLFEFEPDYRALLAMLKDHFGKALFTIKEAEDYTLFSTPFLPKSHLKTKTLLVAEKAGTLKVIRPSGARAGTFVAGTTLQFV